MIGCVYVFIYIEALFYYFLDRTYDLKLETVES